MLKYLKLRKFAINKEQSRSNLWSTDNKQETILCTFLVFFSIFLTYCDLYLIGVCVCVCVCVCVQHQDNTPKKCSALCNYGNSIVYTATTCRIEIEEL